MAANGKSTGTKKKTQSTSRAKQSTTGKNSKKQVNSAVSLEVVLLLIFCIALVLFLCMVGVIEGAFGPAVKKIMLGIFGLIAYVLPILIFVYMCLSILNKGNQTSGFKLAAGLVFLFMTGILICYISGMKLEDIAGGGHIFKDLYEYQGGGGVIFGGVACLFQHILGKAGTIILAILLLLISLVVLTEKSLLTILKNGGKQIVRSVKNGKELIEEEIQNRYEDYEEEDDEDSQDEDRENARDDRRSAINRRRRQIEDEKNKKRERSLQEKERQQQLRREEENERRKQKEQLDDERILSKNSPKEKKINFDLTSASALEGHLKKDELHEITLLMPEDEVPQELSKEYAVPEMNGYNHFSSNKLTEITYADLEEEAVNCIGGETTDDHSAKIDPDANYYNNIQIQTLNPEISSDETAANRDSDLIRGGNSQNEEFEYSLHAKSVFSVQKDIIGQNQGSIKEGAPDNVSKKDSAQTKAFTVHQKETGSNIAIYQAKSGKEDTFADLSSMPDPVTERTHQQNGVLAAPEPVQKPKLFAKKIYEMPPINLLKPKDKKSHGDSDQHLKETALRLQQTLKTFGVAVTVTDISQGPSVTRYELQLGEGIKVNKIVNLADDIKLNLAAQDIRIEAPIPGKAAVGIEIPNKETSEVLIRELLDSAEFKNSASKMTFAVGKDITGKTIVADIAKMPHMLIAGATGSGKSVCINTLIMSILYKANPEEVKLIMIDPKVVELSVYNGIPHLMIPVVTDPKKASAALQWAVNEMTKRYKLFAELGVRDLKGYNAKITPDVNPGDPEAPKILPQIIVIVDELADLMMVASKEVEEAICRLAQLARAAGIHLIIATQRPSVDVITGLIKANMPSRVAFKVTSGVDSRTILDMVGAEKLLGKGDMLFFPQGYSKPLRVQGAFVSDGEVEKVVDFLKQNAGDDVYDEEVEKQISGMNQNPASGNEPSSESGPGSGYDDYFVEACRFVVEKEKASSGMLQRVFKIGFNRAGRIVDQMEEAGVVGPEEGTKPRKVLMTKNELELFLQENGYV